MKKTIKIALIILFAILFITCILLYVSQKSSKTENITSIDNINNNAINKETIKNNTNISPTNTPGKTKNSPVYNIINASGNTLQTRINPPEGYKRTNAKKGSFTEFLRNYKMKKDGNLCFYMIKAKKATSPHMLQFLNFP